METRFKRKSQIVDVAVTAVAAVLSVGIMLYGVSHFGFGEAWPELVLNLCYIACLVMMGLYFFKRLDSQSFNYWSSICAGITVLLRDILFPPPLESYPLHLVCLALSVLLLLMFTFFYARKDWKSYTKRNLWLLLSLTWPLPDCTAMSFTTIPSMNIPTTCSRKSGFAQPSSTDWWPASCQKKKHNRKKIALPFSESGERPEQKVKEGYCYLFFLFRGAVSASWRPFCPSALDVEDGETGG
jgi:hypothetical protein